MTAANTFTTIRDRPLAEVKAEIARRAGHLNPLDGIRAEDAARVSAALTSLDRDEWAREWSKFGAEYEAKAEDLAQSGGDAAACRELYELAFNYFRVGRSRNRCATTSSATRRSRVMPASAQNSGQRTSVTAVGIIPPGLKRKLR